MPIVATFVCSTCAHHRQNAIGSHCSMQASGAFSWWYMISGVSLQVASNRSGAGFSAAPNAHGSSLRDNKSDVMRIKRGAHGGKIRAHREEIENRTEASSAAMEVASSSRQQGASGAGDNCLDSSLAAAVLGGAGASGADLAAGRFREEEFFIIGEKGDRHQESGYAMAERGRNAIAAEVLDLNAEDSEGLAAQKRKRTVWDSKKKRYVQLQPGEEMKAGKRIASKEGAAKKGGKAERGSMYKQWMKQVGSSKAAESIGKGVKGGHSALSQRCGAACCCVLRFVRTA